MSDFFVFQGLGTIFYCSNLVFSRGINLCDSKGLFTWSRGPRSSGVGFVCFHALGDTKQKKLTPLHVNRVLAIVKCVYVTDIQVQ